MREYDQGLPTDCMSQDAILLAIRELMHPPAPNLRPGFTAKLNEKPWASRCGWRPTVVHSAGASLSCHHVYAPNELNHQRLDNKISTYGGTLFGSPDSSYQRLTNCLMMQLPSYPIIKLLGPFQANVKFSHLNPTNTGRPSGLAPPCSR